MSEGAEMTKQRKEFIDYMLAFYGFNGLYRFDYGKPFTTAEISKALTQHIRELGGWENFEGDTLDREAVRDRILCVRDLIKMREPR